MRTWIKEIIVVGIVLSAVTLFYANNAVNWITTLAIWVTFNHAQIADRLQERQQQMDKDSRTVKCYWKLPKLFFAKEVLWIAAFLLMRNYAAIVGSVMFAMYPFWRKIYRKYKPLKNTI